MKKVIILEGKNDGSFMKVLLEKLKIRENDFKEFNNSLNRKKRKKENETTALSTFIDKNNSKKFLLKLEGGKQFSIKIFSSTFRYCLEELSENGLILMIDLDEENVDKRLENIFETINTRHTRKFNFDFEKKKENDHLHHLLINVRVDDREDLGKFHIVFFKKTLEKACEIEGLEYDDRNKKINDFITKDILEFFSPIII